jgi:ABC-2 type transport system permease protein
MKKIFLIGWKDVTLVFRDRAALVLMLLAPFLLTLGLGLVTGRFPSSRSSAISNIPVVLVNQDGGQLGNNLAGLFHSQDLADLFTATDLSDPAQARTQVDQDRQAAAVIIPPGFSSSIIPPQGSAAGAGPVVKIELYTNPTRPTSSGVVKTVLDEFLSRVEVGRVTGSVVVTQLVTSGLISPADAAAVGQAVGSRQADSQGGASIRVNGVPSTNGQAAPFDPLAYMAPGMALMFLMYTVSNGGRSLLAEKAQGTLPRLLISPTTTGQVLAGKVFGIYLTGVVQVLVLIGASTLLFNLKWGSPLAVLALVLAAVAGATGWGMIITALAKTPGQVATIGSATMLIFGILGGSFINLANMPDWFKVISKITPNAWGLDGFTALGNGGGFSAIVAPVAALLVMGGLLFGVAVFMINKRGLVQN